MRRSASWARTDIPAYAAAIVHPGHGVLVVDTGYTQRFLTASERMPGRAHRWATPPVLPFPPALVDQLAVRAIQADDVRHVVVTHAHADHASGLLDFPRATVHMSGHELPENWQQLTALQHLRQGRLVGVLPGDLPERTAPVEAQTLVPTGCGRSPRAMTSLGTARSLWSPARTHRRSHRGLPPAHPGGPRLSRR